MAEGYKTLLSPIEVGGRTLRNRIVKTPAGSRYWSQDGFVTERVKALFDKISAGGAAMVTVDTMAFMPWTNANFVQGGVWDDKFIPGLAELAELVHANGAIIIGQLHHGGPADFTDPVGPSVLTEDEMPLNDPIPRALSVEELENMKEHYFAAVRRLAQAGFDGVEVHGVDGYKVIITIEAETVDDSHAIASSMIDITGVIGVNLIYVNFEDDPTIYPDGVK